MVCNSCGHPNPPGANFCSQCGESLAQGVTGETTRVIPAVEEDGRAADISDDDAQAVQSLPPGHALLIVTRGPDVGARYLLDTDVTTVGRHPDSAIFLNDITVSRHHARFMRQGHSFVVEDQGSLNGTYVNRTLVDGAAMLRHGDEVQIGKFRMVFFVGELGQN